MTDYERLVSEITEKAPYAEGKVRRERRIEFRVPADRVREFLELLKDKAFELLLQITAVDWPDRGEIELIYQVFSITHGTHTFVRTSIPREDAVISTVRDVYPAAETYEREVHDFFQVVFEGNPKIEMPWILEDIDKEQGLSYRKDFDLLGYVKRKYGTLDRYDEDKDYYVI
ncbi:NADH dehydrogenase [Thermococcus sp. P6]|uniref:NADH-quinone oxidoreductase subunit C n=1 Tax=Thermococcus sp. P6 TaxID=122420 RepID=UPI000B5A0BFB|nr:NADH-quinone oxidoreductase subunit C [Thermococcus sp. P6]ASJ10830.1 NADH dehydrogenase [Thermococcus sp. P6]